MVAGGLIVGLTGALASIDPAAATPSAATVEAQSGVATLAAQAADVVAGQARAATAPTRRRLAEALAAAAGVDAAPVVAAWEAAGPVRVAAAVAALTQIGVRYRRLGGSPDEGFDCSGFTSWAWSTVGVSLDHSSGGQLAPAGHGLDDALVGDLVGYPGHVMLYLGGGTVVHSPTTGRTVEVLPLRRHVDHFVSPPVEAAVRNASVMTRVRAF
jgi:peptidoglycan DL-endopeptidase CwlO